MIVKTKEFDDKFMSDISWITINRNLPLINKGSYKVKIDGDIISDIDLTALVHFNNNLLEVILKIIKSTRDSKCPFKFIRMAVGKYEGSQFPWHIDTDGGCNFNLERARLWFDWFSTQELVPPDVIIYIGNKIMGDEISLVDIIDIEYIVNLYSEIIWSARDIEAGFIVNAGITYRLLDLMKTETPVLEFIYLYKDDFVPIDLGLVDKKYAVKPTDTMYRYYTRDWYKIMKSFRWKILPQYRDEYFIEMRKIEKLISLKYQIETLDKIKYQIETLDKITENIILPVHIIDKMSKDVHSVLVHSGLCNRYSPCNTKNIILYITNYINNILSDKVNNFVDFLDPKEKKKIIIRLQRGNDLKNRVKSNILIQRYNYGIKCPFSTIDINDFEKIIDVALRTEINPYKLTTCINTVSDNLKISVKSVIEDIIGIKNKYSIRTENDEIIFMNNSLEIYKFHISYKNILQQRILFHLF